MKNFILVLILILTGNAFACSCADKPTVKEDWHNSTDVYIGEVISLDSTSVYSIYGTHVWIYKIKVLQSFKNKIEKGYEMRTIYADPRNSCVYIFRKLGEKHLIYTHNDSGIIANVSICSRTDKLSAIKAEELQELQALHDKSDKNQISKFEILSVINSDEYDALKLKAAQANGLSYKVTVLYYIIGALILLCLLVLVFLIKAKKQQNNL
jgi:hypothetical protein